MIELLLAVKILTVSNSSIIKHCMEEAQGCINYQQNTIYLNRTNRYMKDFVLYHEIGHLFFPTPPSDVFPENTSEIKFSFDTPEENVADAFGWYIYAQKHPKEQKFYEEVIDEDQRAFVESNCPKECVKAVLKIKLPK